jgi:hypothetical protein
MNVIIYLGADNDARGVLSEMAVERARHALDVYRSTPGAKLLVTGGFGAFNTAPLPHAHYVVEYMLEQGVPADDLLPIVESRHTVEDAALSRQVLAPLDVSSICVVTSGFHIQRAQLIFSCFFDLGLLSFASTPDCISGGRLLRRQAHEANSIALIHRQGGILYQDRLWPLPG